MYSRGMEITCEYCSFPAMFYVTLDHDAVTVREACYRCATLDVIFGAQDGAHVNLTFL